MTKNKWYLFGILIFTVNFIFFIGNYILQFLLLKHLAPTHVMIYSYITGIISILILTLTLFVLIMIVVSEFRTRTKKTLPLKLALTNLIINLLVVLFSMISQFILRALASDSISPISASSSASDNIMFIIIVQNIITLIVFILGFILVLIGHSISKNNLEY